MKAKRPVGWRRWPPAAPASATRLRCRGATTRLDLATFWRQWLSWQATPAQKAWAFHDALACGLAAMARDCATVRGIDTMVCSGGVLHNRLLAARLTFYLADFTLLFAQQLPAGDGAIAYGQAVIAAARGQAQGIQP